MATATEVPQQQQSPGRRRRSSGLKRREARLAYVLIAPATLIVLGLVVFPVLWNITLSLQRIRLIELRQVNFFDIDATLRNFRVVIGARDFWEVIRTTITYTFGGTILSILMGLWAAVVMQKVFIGRSLVRGLMLFPYVAPVIAVTVVWKLMLNPTFGIANEGISALGFQRIDFLGRRSAELDLGLFSIDVPLALVTVIAFEAWRYFPFAFLFILAALQALPKDLDEAAMVDGATISQRFFYVTLPQLRGVLSVLFLLRFIWTFNKFDDIFLLTGGAGGTDVITTKIVDWLRGRADVGAAAALGLVLAGILIVLVAIYFKWFYEEGGVTRADFEERLFGILKWLSVAFFVVITAFPLLYMVGLSFRPIEQLLQNPARFWPSWDQLWGLDTYRTVLRPRSDGGQGFMVYIRNSAYVSVVTVVVTTTLGVLAAYAAARLNFFGKRAFSLGIILVYLFPAVVVAIPLFVLFSRISRRDLTGLMIVYVAQTIPVALYMLRSYFQSIPKELEEAGLIDGLTHFGVMRRITIPLSAPAIAAVALFVFMIAWNEFLYALLFLLEESDSWTLSLGVQQLDTTEAPRTLLMAGSVIITIPVIVLFFAVERFMTEGLTAGGVKG